MHLAQDPTITQTVVDDKTMLAAIKLAGLLVEHALAAWQLMAADQAADDAKRVFEWISR